jgi:hypothetical protein
MKIGSGTSSPCRRRWSNRRVRTFRVVVLPIPYSPSTAQKGGAERSVAQASRNCNASSAWDSIRSNSVRVGSASRKLIDTIRVRTNGLVDFAVQSLAQQHFGQGLGFRTPTIPPRFQSAKQVLRELLAIPGAQVGIAGRIVSRKPSPRIQPALILFRRDPFQAHRQDGRVRLLKGGEVVLGLRIGQQIRTDQHQDKFGAAAFPVDLGFSPLADFHLTAVPRLVPPRARGAQVGVQLVAQGRGQRTILFGPDHVDPDFAGQAAFQFGARGGHGPRRDDQRGHVVGRTLGEQRDLVGRLVAAREPAESLLGRRPFARIHLQRQLDPRRLGRLADPVAKGAKLSLRIGRLGLRIQRLQAIAQPSPIVARGFEQRQDGLYAVRIRLAQGLVQFAQLGSDSGGIQPKGFLCGHRSNLYASLSSRRSIWRNSSSANRRLVRSSRQSA